MSKCKSPPPPPIFHHRYINWDGLLSKEGVLGGGGGAVILLVPSLSHLISSQEQKEGFWCGVAERPKRIAWWTQTWREIWKKDFSGYRRNRLSVSLPLSFSSSSYLLSFPKQTNKKIWKNLTWLVWMIVQEEDWKRREREWNHPIPLKLCLRCAALLFTVCCRVGLHYSQNDRQEDESPPNKQCSILSDRQWGEPS